MFKKRADDIKSLYFAEGTVRTMPRICLLLASLHILLAGGSYVEDDCRAEIELALLIDVSSSYGEGNEGLNVKLFLHRFLDYYHIDANKTHLAVITYAEQPRLLFSFDDDEYQSFEAATSAISAALKDIRPGGRPLTEKALTTAYDKLFNLPPSNDKQRVLFVFTGEKTQHPDLYEDIVGTIEERGVNIVAVSWDETEASKIAGRRGHAVFVQNVADALSRLQEIVGYTCLIHGGYTEWGEWSVCSKTCGGGQQIRQRSCSNPIPSKEGSNCDDLGPSSDTRLCNSQPCGDIDGGYSEWTLWSVCSHDCGGGRMKRRRLCVNPPQQENGQFCAGADIQTKTCNTNKCDSESPCQQGLDLGILIDTSLSVRRRNLNVLLRTLFPPFVRTFQISKSETHFGLITFHATSHFEFNFADRRYYSARGLANRIIGITNKTIFKTRIDRGLLSAYHELFTTRAGDRTEKQNVLLVFTDGRPFPPHEVLPFSLTIPPLREEKKVHIVAVGYGVNIKINRTVLEEIGGDNVLVMDSELGYRSYVSQVKEMVCTVDGGYTQWSIWSLCSASCGSGTQARYRRCNAPPKRNGGNDCKGEFFEVRPCGEMYCPTVPPNCMDVKLNLAIILETSNELGLQHFLAAKEFIKKLLELNDVSPTGTHVSLVFFNNEASDIVSFQQPSSQNTDFLSIILQFLPPQLVIAPGKRLDIALTHVNDNVFNAVTSQGQDITDVAVFITDGRIIDGNNITGTVSSLKEKNIKLVTVSSGTDIRQEVLYDIAGPNMCLSVSLQEMVANVEKVAAKVCNP